MKKPGAGSILWLVVVALVVGCGSEIDSGFRSEAVPDAGADAGRCPEYMPDDAGVVALVRGCPLTIDYAIQ